MKKKALSLGTVLAMALAAPAMAGHHTFPDISDYNTPYVELNYFPRAIVPSVTVRNSSLESENPNMDIKRLTVGLMRERYDDNYSYFGAFVAKGEGDSIDNYKRKTDASGNTTITVNKGADTAINNQLGLLYGSGLHISDFVDWSVFLEVSMGEIEAGGKSSNKLGAGIGTNLMLGLGAHVDTGVTIIASVHYIGAGLGLKVNF